VAQQVIAENICRKTFFIRKEHVVIVHSGQKESEAQGMFSEIPWQQKIQEVILRLWATVGV
jgi:hypothetical protein